MSRSKNDESVEKQKYFNFMISYIAKIIIVLHYSKKYENNMQAMLTEHKNQYVNYSNIVYGIYSKLIDILCKNQLTSDILDKFIKSYATNITCEPNRTFKRKGLVPGTKWYLKKYSDDAASKKYKLL